MFRRSSVRLRLLAAFIGICSLAVLGSGVAIATFLKNRQSLEEITQHRVPSVLASLRLSRQAERLVATAPTLLAATTVEEHQDLAGQFRSETSRLGNMLEDLRRNDIDAAVIEPIESSVRWLTLNLISLETTVGNALVIGAERKGLVAAAQQLGSAMLAAVEPEMERLDDSLPAGGLPEQAGANPGAAHGTPAVATAPVPGAGPLLRLRFEIASLGERLASIASAETPETLDRLSREISGSLDRVEALAPAMQEPTSAEIENLGRQLRARIDGPQSAIRARRLETNARANARHLLAESTKASGRLTGAVDRLVGEKEEEIRRAGVLVRQQQQTSTAVLIAVVLLSLASSALIVWFYVDRSLVRRLTSLSSSMRSISKGDLQTSIPTGGRDEISDMADALKVFRATTVERATAERARANLSRYFSPNLADHLAGHPDTFKLGGERRELTFLFTDLAQFTPLVEQLDPSVIVPVLNEYIGGITRIVFEQGGTVDTVVGDAVHAIFGAPLVQPDHAARGVASALAIDQFAMQFAATKSRDGIPIGVTRIGVHTGTAIVGNFGGEDFFHYTAHGDAVNTAARLETANKALGTRICVSGETASRMPEFRGRPVGELVLKGKASEIEAFEAVDSEEAGSERFASYVSAFEKLKARDPGCLQAFAAYIGKYGDDPLARFHLTRLLGGEISTKIRLAPE